MSLPTILLGILISTAYGAFYHLIRGGGWSRIFFFLTLGWAGFWAGHAAGWWMEWNFFSVGSLNVGMATLLSFGLILLGDWISARLADE